MKHQKQAPKKQAPKIPVQNKETSFFKFMIQKSQLFDCAIILGCCLLAYMVIHYCCPYPFAISDSGGYVEAAVKDIFYVYRPFGYSYFLKILHAITTNIHSIFVVQTFLLFLATYFLALTVKYFYAPTKKWLWYMALSFLIFAPTSFLMANWIMSDLLFSVQIYCIIALFIFIIKRGSWVAAILYILLLFTALHVRYSAVVFPFVLIPFFLMRKGKIRWLIILLSVLTFYVFQLQIKNSMKKSVKMEQFSTGFDGWVYASNVLYVLPHIDLKTEDFSSVKLKNLHDFFMEDIDIITKIANNSHSISSNFMWNNKLSLKQYLAKIRQEQKADYLPTFVKLGSGVYKDYAIYIMTHYPVEYLRYYYLPNCKRTFYPTAGALSLEDPDKFKVIDEYYNIDENNTLQAKHHLFSSAKYHTTIKILHLIMWAAIVGIGITAFLRRRKITFSNHDKIVFWGVFTFAAIYYASSIFAAPMEIRYTIGMHSVQFVFCYMLLNKLVGIKKDKNEIEEAVSGKKGFFRSKYELIVFFAVASIVAITLCIYFIPSKNTTVRENLDIKQIQALEKKNDMRMNNYIEACKFCKILPDSILVITRKPEIFNFYSGNKKAENFPYIAEVDTIMSYLKTKKATHLILDDRFRYAYLTLFPAVQKYPEKFKVLKAIGRTDTVTKQNPTYVLEFNDEWGYHGEYKDGKKDGEGYELFQDGRKYVGNFEKDVPNGDGILYAPNGDIIVKGRWRNGAFVGAK